VQLKKKWEDLRSSVLGKDFQGKVVIHGVQLHGTQAHGMSDHELESIEPSDSSQQEGVDSKKIIYH